MRYRRVTARLVGQPASRFENGRDSRPAVARKRSSIVARSMTEHVGAVVADRTRVGTSL